MSTREALLATLLQNLFPRTEDLHHFLLGLPNGLEVLRSLPGSTAPLADHAHQAALALGARGMIDEDFFKTLARLRPGKRRDIHSTAESWGLALPDVHRAVRVHKDATGEPFDDVDIIAILESWMGNRDSSLNTDPIFPDKVDEELGLPPGSAAKHLEKAARRWDYRVRHRGKRTITFEEIPLEPIRPGFRGGSW